jgi:hypothetical protein
MCTTQLSLKGIHAGEGFEGTIDDKQLLMEVGGQD